MPQEVQTAQDQGVTSLVKGIVTDLGDLIKQHLQFARAEIRSDLRKTGEASVLLALGIGISLLSGLVLTLMLVHLLHWLTLPPDLETPGLPLWACHGIVGGVFLVGGILLVLGGKEKLGSFNPLPDQTVEQLKENLQWKTTANSK